MAARRPLTFTTLDEVAADARRLLAGGCEPVGRWDLAQNCLHLADWMSYPVDGFPRPPLVMRMVLGGMRLTISRMMLRKTMAANAMPAGNPTFPATVHRPGLDEAEAVGRLAEAVGRFQAHPGEYHPSPVFGPLSRDEATRLQLIHCAHHLSFLVPRN